MCTKFHFLASSLLAAEMLQLSTKITVARDCRVVSVPEEDSKVIDAAALFSRILEHVYDPLEPTSADSTASVRAAIGGSQQGRFQDLPFNIIMCG